MHKRLFGHHPRKVIAICLALVAMLGLLAAAGVPARSQAPQPAATAQSKRWAYYLPLVPGSVSATELALRGLLQRRVYVPTVAAGDVQPAPGKSSAQELPSCPHLVTRQGNQLFLEGKPFTFVGVNVSYLLEDYFPEKEVGKVIAYLAESGVTAIRVWLYPQHSLERAERLFDLGRRHNIRFIVTLENYYYDKGAWWFTDHYEKEYLPHVRKVVARFRNRPEIMMWELMNEPNCSTDTLGTCPDYMVRWAEKVSGEIKALDPCRPISVGTIRIDPNAEHYRRLHALPTIDVVSIHKAADLWLKEEIRIAAELNKPVLIGEVYSQAYDNGCRPLYDGVLDKRARIVAADMAQAWQEGVDGYLLWQYGHGRVVVGSEVQHYCGIYDYLQGDPIWGILKAAAVPRIPFPR